MHGPRYNVSTQDDVLQRVKDLVYEIERQFRDGVVATGKVQLYSYRIEAALTNVNRIYTLDMSSVIEGLNSLKRASLDRVNHVEPRREYYISPRLYTGLFDSIC